MGTKCNKGLGQEPLWLCSMYPPQAPSVLDVEFRLLVLECDPVGVCVRVSGFLHRLVLSVSHQQLYDHINIKTGIC